MAEFFSGVRPPFGFLFDEQSDWLSLTPGILLGFGLQIALVQLLLPPWPLIGGHSSISVFFSPTSSSQVGSSGRWDQAQPWGGCLVVFGQLFQVCYL